MKNANSFLKIRKILFLINIFILLSKQDIIENPFLISDNGNPIVLQTASNYYVYTSEKIVCLEKSTGAIKSIYSFGKYDSPYIWIVTETNKYYIYSSNYFYSVSIPSSYSSVSKPTISFPSSTSFVGYIKESYFASDGCLCKISTDEIIIYGKYSTSNIIFSFMKAGYAYAVSISPNLEDKMNCKKIENSKYICAVIHDNVVYILVFIYKQGRLKCEMQNLSKVQFNGLLNTHTDVEIYDTTSSTSKIVCAKNINTNNIECLAVIINFSYTLLLCLISVEVQRTPIIIQFPIKPENNGACILQGFLSEILFCCSGSNLIRCTRLQSNYEVIASFDIEFPGENTLKTILTDTSNYVSLFFENNYSSKKVYEYYIYPPTCKNLNYVIIVHHSINEDREGNEDDINDLFERKTNTEYYFEFETLPDNYGDLMINGKKMSLGNNTKFLIENGNSYTIDFNSTNDNIITNFSIPYKISIFETYSVQCTINLTILPCYISCTQCTKSDSESDSQNHNCIEAKCKDNYYPAPVVVTNCFSEEEKEHNWYLDIMTDRFDFCDSTCYSCYQKDKNNCLTCFPLDEKPENAYLYEEECISQCPEGTYAELQSGGYYKCKNCYANCKTCSGYGDRNNMKCDSCNENNIIYNKNCYIEYNSDEKTFYQPGSNTDITSCRQLLNYYIEENTYECVSSIPSTGYFLVNSDTGLFAKCHEDCKTCSERETDISSKCDTCNNDEYYILDGNCISKCPDGYYSATNNGIKICKECYQNCMTCNAGATYSNSNKLTNMNCLKCAKDEDPDDPNIFIENKILLEANCFPIIEYTEEKITFDISEISTGESEKSCLDYDKSIIYGDYQCITKPTNSYYVLNNDDNTGVLKYCDNACATCNGGKIWLIPDTNCITCAEGYYKTEDSNTNCILESLIPENYYKNNMDNIYYKCYINCKKCNNFYNAEEDDMNCVECISEYYFVYGTNNCYDISFLDDHDYFLSDKDNKFHQCYFSCLKCSQLELDEFNHNCDECIDGFYFEDNTKNCYNMSVLERGYYFDDFTINEGENPVFKKCYENCKTCTNSMIGNNMNCILCKNDSYKVFETNNCYDESLKSQGYYLKDDIFYPCEESCQTCSDSKAIIDELITNNCLSCDSITKGLYLVADLNNCEPESFKENGYYLQGDENNPDLKIFYKCYSSCDLCDKGKEYDILTEQDNHNCLSCKENFYPKKNDGNPKNCYNEEEMAPQGYGLVRNYWQICHENCETCESKPLYENNILISQKCLSCYGDLHFIYETSDCTDDTILEKGYYFDDYDLMYHKCDIQCKSCEKYSTYNDPKCTSCNADSFYFPAYNKPSSRCYNKTTIDDNYVLSTFEDSTTGEITRKWMICYETCKTCAIFGDETENNCITCISKYYLIYGTSNCIKGEEAEQNGYYYNSTYRQYVKCDIACSTCKAGKVGRNTNCIKCNEELGYYPLKKNNEMCFSEEDIGEGFYFDNHEKPYGWVECYEYCASCLYKGNANKMACLSCKADLINEEFNKTMYLKLVRGNCNLGCPDNLFLTKYLDCVPSCLNETYEYIPNVTCVDTCPENYELNPERTRCVFTTFTGSTSTEEFKDIIFSNISSFVDSDTVINGTNFKAQIISASEIDPVEQIKNGISGLDLGECIQTLKTKYNIPENEDLIVIEIETKEDKEKNKNLDRAKDCIDLGKNVKVSICDYAGNILDMSLCDNDITVMKYVGDVDDIDINTAMEYAEQGIDVFNTQDAFFNDRCSKFNSDKDVILGDRRNDYFQNVSFCGDDCLYSGMDYTLMIAKCSCDSSNIQEENGLIGIEDEEKKGITLNDLANSFTSEIFSFNFDVIKCYNLVFDAKILKKNQGFYSLIIMVSIQIFILIYFSMKRLKPIRNYMLVFEPFDPRIDPPNPPKPKKNMKKEKPGIKKGNLYNLLNLKNDISNKNLSKKEKEIQKTILITNLLNKSKFKKRNETQEDEDINNDALVVHYEISDDSSSSKSKDKYPKIKDFFNNYNSDSNSEYHEKKKDNSLLKHSKNSQNLNFSSLKRRNSNNSYTNQIYNRNAHLNLKNKNIFSKETLLTEGKKSKFKESNIFQRPTLTLASNSISPKNINFNEINVFESLAKSLEKSKNYNNSNQAQSLKIFKKNKIEKGEEVEDEKNMSIVNSKKSESDNNSSEYINSRKKKNKKISRNKNDSTLKHAIKNKKRHRNLNIMASTDALFSNEKNNLKESKSVKHYHRNKFDNNKRNKMINELTIQETKKTDSGLNKKKEDKKEELGNMRLKYKKINLAYTNEEFNEMDFEEALINDNRSFYKIYVTYILEEHIIFNTFCTDLYLELRSIKLSFLIFGFEINFFLNALFYTDEYISDTYHNDGVLDFFSSLPKSIYSFIVTLVISNLLKMLSSSKKQLLKIIKEKEDKNEYLKELEYELNKFKKKITFYFIIVLLLSIFFSYYTSAFCAVYQNSQTFWLIGCLESLALDFATPFLICAVLSVLRYIGLKKRTKCVYNAAKFLGKLM